MSTATTRDPLVVNTKDGACWERRAVTSDGHGLYAAAGSCKCPEYLLVPLSELAEHGIVGTADALPEPQTAPITVYRAGFQDHDIPLGFYQTREEARKHCEAFARRELPDWEFAWDDEEDGVQELMLQVDGKFNDWSGYVVTALEVASRYDEEADE